MKQKKQGNSAMKSAEEWLPFNLCSKKLAAVTKIWESLFVQRFLKEALNKSPNLR